MATIDTIANRSTGTAIAGKAYFETSTNKFIVFNGSAWIELDSDGVGAVYENRWGASFDGSDDYLDLGSNTFINKSNPFSISTWFKLDSWATNYPGICVIKTAGTQGLIIGLSDTQPYSGVWVGSNETNGFKGFSTSNAALAVTIASGWHHLVLTYDGVDSQASSSRTLYIDGTEYGITSFVALGNSSNNNYIGRAANRTIDGMVDDFAIFNTELDQAAVTALYGAAPNAGIPSEVTGAIGYWRMGDDSSDSPVDAGNITGITDSSGNGNDATQATASNQPTFKALEQATTSLSFDGSNDYLEVPHSTDLELTTAMTWSAWVNMNTTHTTDYPYLFAKWNSTGAAVNYTFYTQTTSVTSGHFKMRYWISGQAQPNSTDIPRGQWVHLAAVHNGTGLTYYINGVADNTITVGVGSTNTGNLIIGQAPNGIRTFPGEIDEAAIFNSALSASDVASLASSRGAHVVNDLSLSPVAYYRMGEDDSLADGASVSQITDASGNGNHATQATAANQPTASIDPVIYV